MEKERGLIFWKTSLIAVFLVFANFGIYFFNGKNSITGFSIKSSFQDIYANLSLTSKILIISVFVLLILAVIIAFFKDRKTIKVRNENLKLAVSKKSDSSKTDLDSLYSLLKEKKQIKLISLPKAFNVDENIIMEWCKILESSNLASIEYPGIRGKPILVLVENEKEDNKEKNNKN